MSNDSIDILFPVGRLVQGNLYEPNTKDAQGNPLIVKTGPNKGQPRIDYFFAVAIPKGAEQHWAHTEWGQKIWAFANAMWPQGQTQRPDFAWKIVDGDSAIPNKRNVKPCDMVGHKGHWVVKFSGGFAPKIVNADGSAAILEQNAVKPGYYVQAFANIASNKSSDTAGIYINHRIVALSGYGEEITFGPDASAVGFGGALPAGASATPVGAMSAPPVLPVSMMPAVGIPQVPGASPIIPAAPAMVATPPPNMAFVNGTSPPVMPPPAHVMLPAANGASYEAMIAAGWNDAQLIAHGMMQA